MTNLISAVMIVRNGALTVERSLESLQSFPEVIVFDNGSTDGTLSIAKRFSNVRLIEGSFEGFGPTKNKAASFARHDWILIVDADEVVEPELAQHVLAAPLDPTTIYLVNRKAFYKDIQVRYGGWNNEKIRRLYHRQHTQFTASHVHENLVDDGMQLSELPSGSIRHYSYHSISEFITKMDRYSTLFAENHRGRKTASPFKAITNGGYSFFRTYVIKRGFLDGYVGLLIAFSHMATNFYKYMKLYEANQQRSDDRQHSDR